MKTRLIAAVIGAWIAAPVLADPISLNPFENASNAPTAGLNFTLDLIVQGSTVDLVFENQSSISSIITSMYIEQTPAATALIANPALVTPFVPGVQYSLGASPPNPPGSIAGFGGPWQGTWVAISPDAPPSHNGLAPGELVAIRFDLLGTPAQLESAIMSGDIRIVQHVQGLAGGASLWTTTVPTPGAGVLLAAGAIILARRRRH